MATLTVQSPAFLGIAPNYQACTATDKFLAQPGATYMLHYKNGATAQTTGPNKVGDTTTPIPAGSSAAAGFADVATSGGSGLGSTSELVVLIPNASRFMDGQNFVNLTHPGTLTTVTVAIFGPL